MPEQSFPAHGTAGGRLSRRSFLTGAGLSVAGAAAASAAACATDEPAQQSADAVLVETVGLSRVPFDGPHQAGIATPAQAHLNLVAFQVRAGVDAAGVQRLLRLWTQDARRLTQGQAPLGDLEPEMVTSPANLTITCGFGPRLFDIIGKPEARPEWLHPIEAFSRDELDERYGEADLVLQLCCDDPLTLSHATRHMIRSGIDYVTTAWLQQGFLTPPGHAPEETPRNLFGLKDGTVNPRTPEELDAVVWIDAPEAWLRGGSCMVVRRIAMNMDTWEILDRASREVAFGRTLDSGAPLTGTDEFDAADFDATDSYGLPIIDPMSHMARSTNPADRPGEKILRRAYNYDEAPIPGSEETSNSGLVFICYQKNPDEQFTPIQRRLNDGDRLNQWITHTGSAVFVMPAGVEESSATDSYWGQPLFEA
ncbi:peroxidase [Corynebacterium sp. 13CS0277]|uniref:Dyp-type peroxidase n=1 Tax=Corynebacterium sp. 13CS0277 TaxID=2071994 RepID=UPI000D041097|nr:Dyp-type peroxidase [Corynebacterium sp. 13CS0277]PRQ11986.1 peroxidase [Corynebacterium sp. 13CS0277]